MDETLPHKTNKQTEKETIKVGINSPPSKYSIHHDLNLVDIYDFPQDVCLNTHYTLHNGMTCPDESLMIIKGKIKKGLNWSVHNIIYKGTHPIVFVMVMELKYQNYVVSPNIAIFWCCTYSFSMTIYHNYILEVKNFLFDLPAYSTFFTMVRILVHTGEMFTDGTEISRHFPSTFTTFSTVFANL